MSLKAKLVSTISAFCLVLALLVVGVFAASNATVNLSGSLSFTADDVMASISVTSTGAETDLSNKTGTLDQNSANVTMDNLDLVFATSNTPIVITVTITNDSDNRAFTVQTDDIAVVVADKNVTLTSFKYNNNSAGDQDVVASKAVTVAANTSVIYTITLNLTNPDANVAEGAAWSVDFALANVAA